MTSPTEWTMVEAWVSGAFAGLMRKGGHEPMTEHSIRIGRSLLSKGHDAITVFGGYMHDVFEDTGRTEAEMLVVAQHMLHDQAPAGIALARACCYTPEEYALPKLDRKRAACARWISHTDPRVWAVKREDVLDNKGDAHRVSEDFLAGYLAWADPLEAGLVANMARGVPLHPHA